MNHNNLKKYTEDIDHKKNEKQQFTKQLVLHQAKNKVKSKRIIKFGKFILPLQQ